ncbi:MAG: polyphosphate kinase 1 [Verrucomicrobiales bacterium]|nr:polyphosphate kinase 1 [Verrucomicrobiales bacterium]
MKSSSRNLKPSESPAQSDVREEHFINRELSWLAFNERVLEEAERRELPLLERAKFLAITASNLDEFFMVRVGALQLLREQRRRVRDAAGMSPTQQWDAIQQRVSGFIERQYRLLDEELLPGLREHGIRRLAPAELTPAQRTHLQEYFLQQIYPVLSPIAVDDESVDRLMLPALQIVLLGAIESADESGAVIRRHVVITLPTNLPRHIVVPDAEGGQYLYVNLEDVVSLFMHQFFPSETVVGLARFRLSRNSDIAVDDESAFDLATEMEEVLEARQRSSTIRVEIERGAPRPLLAKLRQWSGARGAQVFEVPGELDLKAYFAISGLSGFEELTVESWDSDPHPAGKPGESIFEVLRRGDVLLNHPYDSFEPVLQLVEEAAADPGVMALKMILYRTAKNSRIISALIRAAEAGKHVTVLVELKARFDEARNLERAEDLLRAGAQIIYGVRGLKTHAKICMVVRREAGRVMRYMHFGTGNYNEATAKLYTDISYLTCRADYGADASAFFNTVTGRSRFVHFGRISMAPFGLRERLLGMIRSETERARQGEEAEIQLKMNSLEDRETIEALYEASAAGVQIRLNIRGICCLRPGVKGLSETIEVISIIDRYLEHARIYAFKQGGNRQVFISSADMMNRNLSRRVELLVPIEEARAKKRLLSILENGFKDNQRARKMGSDGVYQPVRVKGGRVYRSQEQSARAASRRARESVETPDVLVPHTPKQKV